MMRHKSQIGKRHFALGGRMKIDLRYMMYACSTLALGALAGCGDGGSTDSTVPPAIPTLSVTLSAPSRDVTVDEGQTATFGFTANYTGTSKQPVVADVKVGGTRYVLDGTPTSSGTGFAVSLKTLPLLADGKDTSTVTFRLCTAADCATVYPGSTATFTVNLDARLKDWSTIQRDAAHTGYVAVKYNTADFADAWNMAGAPLNYGTLRGVAARRGNVFVNVQKTQGSSSELVTRALNASNGATVWEYHLGQDSYFSAPSYANGRVITAAMNLSSGTIPMDVIDADKGTYLRSLSYASQFSNVGTPTPLDDNLYLTAGYFGNEVFGYNAAAGTRQWDGSASGAGVVQEGESPAADAQLVYYFSGGALFGMSRTTGAVVHKISNPFFSSAGLSYFGFYYGAPILDGAGHVFTFSDNRSLNQPLPLVAFSTDKDSVLWRTSGSYVGDPALHDGKLYAIRTNSSIIDIINTTDGSVTGSIDLGSGKGPLTGNVVLTASHLFVASSTATYAIDLQQPNFPTVWSAPHGGPLAITPDNMLVVSATTGGLYAYRLH
jgi:hypothetical protein